MSLYLDLNLPAVNGVIVITIFVAIATRNFYVISYVEQLYLKRVIIVIVQSVYAHLVGRSASLASEDR